MRISRDFPRPRVAKEAHSILIDEPAWEAADMQGLLEPFLAIKSLLAKAQPTLQELRFMAERLINADAQ